MSGNVTKKVQNFSNFLKKYLPLFVLIDIILALIIGFFFPTFVKSLRPFVVYGVFIMLFPMMMGVHVKELKLVIKDIKILLVSVLINFILSPLIAYLWAELFFRNLDPGFVAGWILKLTVPCSSMLVAWTGLSQGKTETALFIQVISFFVAIFAIPLWMVLLVGNYIPVDFLFIAQKILFYIVIPLFAGIAARELIIHNTIGKEVFKKDIKPFLPPISSIGMYFVIFVAIAGESRAIIDNLHLIWILIGSFFVVYPLLIVLSIFISKFSKIKYANAIAIVFGTSAKNHGIALAIAITAFGGLAVLPSSIIPMFQVLLMLLVWKISPRIRNYFGKGEKAKISVIDSGKSTEKDLFDKVQKLIEEKKITAEVELVQKTEQSEEFIIEEGKIELKINNKQVLVDPPKKEEEILGIIKKQLGI